MKGFGSLCIRQWSCYQGEASVGHSLDEVSNFLSFIYPRIFEISKFLKDDVLVFVG